MDMGFARRARSRANAGDSAGELASLLAAIAARQALSPTAKAVTGRTQAGDLSEMANPEVTAFVPGARENGGVAAAVSFHPRVSAAILSSRKSS
jgi:hypothetical protein